MLRKEYRKKYYQENKDKINRYARGYYKKTNERRCEQNRNTRLKREFGLDHEKYNKILLSQNGVCAICHCKETSTYKGKIKRLAVDHCHKTGKVRGLLCQGCNQAIGHAKDSIEILTNAVLYLKGL